MNSKKVGKSNGLEENSSLNRILEDMGEYEERKNGKRKEIRKYRNGRRKEMNEKEMIRSFDGYRGVNERIEKSSRSAIKLQRKRDKSVILRLRRINESNQRPLPSEYKQEQNINQFSDVISIRTTITTVSTKSKENNKSARKNLIKRNLELLDKLSGPKFTFLKRKQKENGVYSEIKSYLSKISQISKGSKISSKTFSNQIQNNKCDCIACFQDTSEWKKTSEEKKLIEFIKQFFITEHTENEKVDEIEQLCQKCLINKYFDDDNELYQKFCDALAIEFHLNNGKSPEIPKLDNINEYDVNYSVDVLNNTLTLPKLNLSIKKKKEKLRKNKECQDRYGRVINHYSNDFPNPVIPLETEMKWKHVCDELFKDDLK